MYDSEFPIERTIGHVLPETWDDRPDKRYSYDHEKNTGTSANLSGQLPTALGRPLDPSASVPTWHNGDPIEEA